MREPAAKPPSTPADARVALRLRAAGILNLGGSCPIGRVGVMPAKASENERERERGRQRKRPGASLRTSPRRGESESRGRRRTGRARERNYVHTCAVCTVVAGSRVKHPRRGERARVPRRARRRVPRERGRRGERGRRREAVRGRRGQRVGERPAAPVREEVAHHLRVPICRARLASGRAAGGEEKGRGGTGARERRERREGGDAAGTYRQEASARPRARASSWGGVQCIRRSGGGHGRGATHCTNAISACRTAVCS